MIYLHVFVGLGVVRVFLIVSIGIEIGIGIDRLGRLLTLVFAFAFVFVVESLAFHVLLLFAHAQLVEVAAHVFGIRVDAVSSGLLQFLLPVSAAQNPYAQKIRAARG